MDRLVSRTQCDEPFDTLGARLFCANAATRSAGILAERAPSYARSHRPSRFARSTSARPGTSIVPAAISASTFARLIFDHGLLAVRGVNRWSHETSLNVPFCPSIHPHASAASSASPYVTEAESVPFFATFSHNRISNPSLAQSLMGSRSDRAALPRPPSAPCSSLRPCATTRSRSANGPCRQPATISTNQRPHYNRFHRARLAQQQ